MLSPLSRVEVAEHMTADEFFQVAPETQKAELIRGRIIVSPPPLDVHERVNQFLLRLMAEFVEMCDLGEVRGSRTAVRLSDTEKFYPLPPPRRPPRPARRPHPRRRSRPPGRTLPRSHR